MTVKNLLKMLSQHVILPFCYNLNRFRKVDKNRVLFADAHHVECPNHMADLRDALKDNGYTIEEYYVDLVLLGKFRGLIAMAHFMKMYSRCAYVVVCDNFISVAACRKKKATKVIQLWHGSGAFKKFGFDARDDIGSGYKGNVYKNYNLVTVSGDYPVEYFKSAMRLEDDIVKPYGVCHTDRFFDETFKENCLKKFRRYYPDAAEKKVVLWAPSFRGNAAKPKLYGENIVNSIRNDKNDLEKSYKNVYLIKSLHPHFKQDNSMTTEELMVCADILITDYSSVMFDFLLLDKPMIFFAPDYSEYIRDRGFYLEYEKLPGVVITGDGDDAGRALVDSVVKIIDGNDEYADERKTFRNRYMNACDGHVVERIMQRMKEL